MKRLQGVFDTRSSAIPDKVRLHFRDKSGKVTGSAELPTKRYYVMRWDPLDQRWVPDSSSIGLLYALLRSSDLQSQGWRTKVFVS